MPRKENTKAKTWERDRRKRMNAYFKTLADLLPPHQEGRKRNKVDILIHASKYIKDLHSRTEELFSTHASEAYKEELARLKKLVTQLTSRTQLLSTLLKEAGISVPAEPALEKISPLKWSNKINVDDVDKYFDKIEEKKTLEKKKKEKSTENKVPSKRKSATPSALKKSEEAAVAKKACNLIENQENRVNCANDKNYNSDSTSSLLETGSKETEHCQNDSANEATATGTTNMKKKTANKKIESQKSLKKKRKRKNEKNSTLPHMANTVTNLTPNTLILSGGKLMPLVAPMTSNIIVNTQQASTNPIILGNTQQSQMIVMQPLANRVQNSVVSICNHALINTVKKVTLNTVPSIRANMVVDSHNWASNVKNIINATKIGGHKGILPKGKEITKTTMAYKVPIPAIHKEKVEKSKDNVNKKESEVKTKGNKSNSKSHKSIQNTSETVEESLNVEKKSPKEPAKTPEDVITLRKAVLKRGLSAECDSDEPDDKKRKDTNGEAKSTQPITSKAIDFTATCKSIVSLKHVIEKIGENIPDEHTIVNNEKESIDLAKSSVVTQVVNNGHEETSTSKLIDIVDTNCFDMNKKITEDIVTPQIVLSDKFSSESHETVDRPSNDFNMSIDNITERNSANVEHLDAKSTLTEVEVAEKAVGSDRPKKTCNLGTRFDSLLRVATVKEQQRVNDAINGVESNKIILNLDTNTTTTMNNDSDANIVDVATSVSASSSSSSASSPLTTNIINDETKLIKTSKDELSKSLSYTTDNTFVPISNRTDGLHSDLSNDIFASLHVPSSSHNPESISPTAAFLMAFPLVSSLNGKTEVLDEEMKDDFKYHSQTPPMLLQIGTMEPNSFKIKTSSPPHAIAEKTPCEEKQITSANVNTNTDVIVSMECTTTKSLPKVVNEETLREPYKIVQTVLTPSLEKSVMTTTTAFPSHNLINFPVVNSSCNVGNSTSSAMNQGRPDQLRTTSSTLSSVNVIASQTPVNISASTDKSDIADCTSSQIATSRNPDIVYSGAQDFLPNYSTIVGNGLGTMQHTSNSSMFKNIIATTQESNPVVSPRVDSVGNSQNLLSTRLENTTVTTNSSSTVLRSLQTDYSTQTKDKGSQNSSHVIYSSNNKDTLIDSTDIVSDHRANYANQMDRSLPVTSQSMQSYSLPTKDSSLPILSSQDMQHIYSQTKDSHVLLDLNGSQQTFTVQKKQEHIIASSHNDYVGNQTKVMSQKDSISYTSGDNEAGSAPSRNQEYVTKTASQNSPENTFQRNYSKLNKSTDTLNNSNQVNQEAKSNDTLGSKTQEQQHNHMRDSAYVPAKKLDVDPFVQSYQYDVKEAINNPSERTNVLNTNTDDTHSDYVSYPSKDDKKTNVAVSTIAMANKSAAVQQSTARYSQQVSSFITTSNYEQSTITENHTKSTTTVAHNSSNFSILSWTTFSPVSGGGGGSGGSNNNLIHYDQGQSHPNDNNEAKTICENYSYVPLHKDNSSFPNQVLIGDNYPSSSIMSAGLDKSRQGKIESQKQSFVDPSKIRNDPSKQNRMQNQQTGNDYKFSDGGKSKNKYSMDSDYMQNEYNAAMDQQQHSQQHGQKNHQNLSSKQEKTIYAYESQINFDLTESNVQMKYPIEAYTGVNFKYAEKTTQQPSQHKYQVLTQGQSSLHDNGNYNDVKHSQQQQQSHNNNNNDNNNKSKSNQHQQHAIKAPINWMMTPEVKHNANITDIILPPIGKELEFCPNNLFTQTPSYNQSTPNQFYNNYDVSAAHSFSNLPVLQSDPKRSAEAFYSEEQPFPWSPTKNSIHNSVEHAIGQSSVKCIDQHIVPSSLQSLVSDLDLNTNLEKQNFLFGAATSSSRISTEQSKDASIKEKEANNVSGRDLHAILNNQNAQHPASTFLSVSQLVEHEKAEKSHQQQNHQHHQHHHPHQHHSQQHQQQQQQARKHQRKSNASPRTTSKRQMDIRKSTTTSDNNLHQRHEEQKSSGHVFTEQGYQQPQQQQQQSQQKYQQNNVHWRSRNCKSNYTAEALIGIHDTSGHQDKHASIKFTSNYPQNKFQSGLSTDAAVMPINYFSSAPPPDDGTAAGYGQSVVNQNFNTYTYSSNSANSIYPTSNFITSISNTPNSYMTMPLHENTDYVQETNSFLLSNVAGTSSSSSASTANTSSVNTTSTTTGNANGNGKNHQHYGKHPNCDKRSYSTTAKKGKRKVLENGPMQNLEFPLSGINSPLEDYHHSTFLAPPPPPPPPPPPHTNPLYQNHPQTNVYAKTVNSLPPPPPSAMASAQGVATVGAASFSMNSNMVRGGIVSSNSMAMPHHPSGTSLTNFNLSTIFPEINDKVTGYKSSNGIPPGLSQTPNQPAPYVQRSNYPSNSLCHLPQVSEGTQFINSVPPLPVPPAPPPATPSLSHGVIHYKNL